MSNTEVKTEDKGKGRDDDFDPWTVMRAILHEAHLTREPYQYEIDATRRAYDSGQSVQEYRRTWNTQRETALRDLREAAASKSPQQTKKPAPKQRTDPDPDDDPDDPDDGSDDGGSSGGNGPSAG